MRTIRQGFCGGVLAVLVACGGGGGGGDGLVGPFVIDFEDRPDDSFVALDAPVTLANGVAITAVSPASSLYDFTTANGWGLEPCVAEASSGDLMMGVEGLPGTMTITFSPRVSRVEVFASASDGYPVELEAFGAGGVPLGLLDSETSECPSLRADDFLEVEAGANSIESVEIRGRYVVIDDLMYYFR